VGRTLVANKLLAGSACGKRHRARPLNSVVRHQREWPLRHALGELLMVVLIPLWMAALLFTGVLHECCGLVEFAIAILFASGMLFESFLGGGIHGETHVQMVIGMVIESWAVWLLWKWLRRRHAKRKEADA
jgi:hypothetical protein